MRIVTNGLRILRGATAALCERHRDERKSDSSTVMSAFRANAALLRSAWGNVPGFIDQEHLSTESGHHERHESRLQCSPIISIQFPGAMPQVRHGESVLWRTLVESPLSALKTLAVTDCRYNSYVAACNSKPAGFSLVEIVLALGVVAFCLIAVVGLMPVGVQINRNASSQTAATNIMATIVSDLRTTPAAATTSPQFGITFGTDKTLYFDASGQASTSLSPASRYQLNIRWNSAAPGLYYADLKATWPASVDPTTAAPGSVVAIFAAFDRN
jgi:uncharacterized protein (TIGR02598 family)